MWQECADRPASCAELSTEGDAGNMACQPGCYCPSGTVLLVNVLRVSAARLSPREPSRALPAALQAVSTIKALEHSWERSLSPHIL